MEHNVENCPIKKEMEKLEKDYNELQANLQLSAVYGKGLLDEINNLKHQITSIQYLQEASVQENHSLRKQLEVSQKLHVSQNADMETLKELLQKSEELNKQLKTLDEEQHRKESSLVSQMANFKDREEAHKEKYEQRIKELEEEKKNMKSAEQVSVQVSCNHEEEISQLQMDLNLTNQSRNKIEEELISKQNEIQQLHFMESKLHKKISEFEYEVLAKEKALASSEKLLEEKRIEILELQALLEAERVSQSNPEKRGNSIFSEVEDRRQQVERQLTKLTTLLDREKRKNQDLQAEIVKVKNHMAFLSCPGNNSESSKTVERLETLLRSTISQNKDLLKKIEDLERKVQSSCQPVLQLEDSKKWMQAMLSQKQEEIDKLRTEIRDHIRSYLCQTDQAMQLTKRLTETENNLQQARKTVVQLNLKIEQMKRNENASNNASPSSTALPTRVTENLKFVMEKKETVIQPDKPLREIVVLENQLEHNTLNSPSNIDESIIDKEKNSSGLDIPIKSSCDKPAETLNNVQASHCAKRQVRMHEQVHVVYEDGDSTMENLAEDKFTAGAKSVKPVGKIVEVVDVSTAAPAMECNQQ